MTANRWAAVAALVAYLPRVEWVDLYPWNDVRHGNGQESLDLVLALVTLALAAGLWVGGRVVPLMALMLLGAWAWLQAISWWNRYLQGASPGWRRVYAHWFAGTIQALPGDATHLPPDASHLVLQILILVALGASLWATLSRIRGPASAA